MNLVWIYWPSGSWKTTLQTRLLNCRPEKFVRVILDTDRPIRRDTHWKEIEFEGQDYHFVTPKEFASKRYLFVTTHWDRNYGVPRESEAVQEIAQPTSQKIGIIVWWRKLMEKMQKEWWYNLFFIQILLGIDSIRSGMFKRWDQFHDVLERIRDIYNQEVWVGPSMRVTQGYSIAEINEAILSHYSLCQ